ncbi:MAG: hypothetical protein ILA19_00340 [Bacilli bacterium]|nr:hypothetical protein [Bacilli bacterium]
MGRKKKEEIIKEQEITVKQLFRAYTFLLCATLMFLYAAREIFIDYSQVKLSVMSMLFPSVYFLSCITNKDLGYKEGVKAVVISTIVLLTYGSLTNFIITGSFQITSILSIGLGYFMTQSVCLSIYNYFLVNTRLPIFLVIVNYIFCCLIFNMIYMLFNYRGAMTESFWLEYLLLIIIQTVFAIVLGIVDSAVERGIDN